MTAAQRKEEALAVTDEMPAELRACVHEFGLPIVTACVNAGVSKPAVIRQLVAEIWDGARQTTQQRRRGPISVLDWVLIQAGAQISAATLLRVLRSHSMVIIPLEPTTLMVEASMDAVNHMGVVSKSRKHRNRLRAAINVGAFGLDKESP
jgi:MinD-like ATPase involved in chromosome partitioning or flagellar assembly